MEDRVRLPPPNLGLEIRIATDRRELTGAYELVYRSFLHRGYIRPHPGRIVYRRAFGHSYSRTIVASTRAKQIVGTLTVVGDSPLGLQLEAAFSHEVQSLRDQGRNVCEITCLAVESRNGPRPTAMFFALTRFMLHYASGRGYDDLLMAIHPRHYRFYWRHYRAHIEASPRHYRCAEGNLAACCRIDLHYLEHNMTPEVRQFYFPAVLPADQSLAPPMKAEDRRYFCLRSGIAADTNGYNWCRGGKDAA